MQNVECRTRNAAAVTLICFALKEEAAPFLRACLKTRLKRRVGAHGLQIPPGIHLSCRPGAPTGRVFKQALRLSTGRPEVLVLITGIGQRNAEKSLRDFLVNHAPTLVLTCGFAGGLNPGLKLGDVVFETSSGSSRGDEAHIELGTRNPEPGENMVPPHVGCYERLIAAGAKPAKCFCADRIAITVAEKKKLRDETHADAIEMESEAIQAICRKRGIPCATVRVISDTAGEDLPLDFNQLAKPDLNLDYGKLALALAKSPGKIGALLRLRKQTRFAAEELAKVLAKVIWPA